MGFSTKTVDHAGNYNPKLHGPTQKHVQTCFLGLTLGLGPHMRKVRRVSLI